MDGERTLRQKHKVGPNDLILKHNCGRGSYTSYRLKFETWLSEKFQKETIELTWLNVE